MATPVLNNGIFLRDTNYKASSHVDSYHLTQMLGSAEPMDMGPIDLWAMTQKVEMPLYQMASFGGKNTIMVDNARGEYKWQTPIAQDLPYSLGKIDSVTDATGVARGIDGQTFKILLSKRTFGHGDIITYDKYNGKELYVTADDILPSGDGFVYTVQLVNNDNAAGLADKYLVSGTKFFRKGSARGEYGERFSDLETGTGFREFYNFVGGAEAHVHYSISSRADLMLKGGMNADGTIPVTEIWRTFDQDVDPSVSSLESMVEIMGADYVKRAFDNGNLSRTFLTNMEAAHLNKVASDIETYLMWGHGGRVKQDGPDDIRMSVGLWKQLDNSYKRIYNKSSFSLDMFKTELYNFYQGKIELEGPDPKRTLIVQTGIGGMKLVNDAIAKEAAGLGSAYVTNTDALGMVTGSGMDLGFGYAFTSYVIPFLANVRFVLNSAFDNLHTNDIENPLGRTQGFASSGNFNGYRVMMTQTMPAVWVKDPTKVLKIVMKNPVTGGSF